MRSELNIPEAELYEFSKRVELAATRLLEGAQRSPKPGSGIEFHSLRPFSEGEEIKNIDWKRYAATDRLYTRLAQNEKKTAWSLVLDSSGSMAYGTKSEYAQLFSACLMFLFQSWGDQWSFQLEETGSDLQDAFRKLLAQTFEGKSKLPPLEERPSERLVILSDGFSSASWWRDYLREAKSKFASVHFVQILDSRELNFDFEDFTEFRDLESRARMSLHPKSIRESYLKELEDWSLFLESELSHPHQFIRCEANKESITQDMERFFEEL